MTAKGHWFAPEIFRAYDIRGITGRDLTVTDAFMLGRTLGTLYGKPQNLDSKSLLAVVGYDGRHTSPLYCDELARGLVMSGINVMNVGLVPTPALYFSAHVSNAAIAVMVTGSHNPPEYNGFKIMIHNRPLYGSDLAYVRERALQGQWHSGNGQLLKSDVIDAYVARLIRDYPYGAAARPLRVGWDPGNGAMGPATLRASEQLPGEHFLINENVDGDFPAHHPDPTVEDNLTQLKNLVRSKGLDLGIGFDGDGDRIGVIDDRGRVVWGDQILALMAQAILPDCPPGSAVLADVKTSQTVFDEIERLNGRPVMCPTGHSIIKDKMNAYDSPLAGEMSGHIFIKKDFYGFDDALYVAIMLLGYLARHRLRLSQIMDQFPQVVNTPEIRIPVTEANKFEIVDHVRDSIKDVPANAVTTLDGVRVKEQGGWWLLRASNTQPVLTVRIEADTPEILTALKQKVQSCLEVAGVSSADLS